MEESSLVRFVFLLCLVSSSVFCLDDSDQNATVSSAVYIVTLKDRPSVHFSGRESSDSKHVLTATSSQIYRTLNRSASIIRVHDSLLRKVLRKENYLKLYSYHYLINGFSAVLTRKQADRLAAREEVDNVVLDFPVEKATTHTPQFLGLPRGAWLRDGGSEYAGEGVVIGFIDTGIDPTHPSFSDKIPGHTYSVPPRFTGVCEVTIGFPPGSCNRKLIGARHFAESALSRGVLNSSQDDASPFDGEGHGTHTASVAAGNHGIPVVVAGHHLGNASGMAPRAHIAIYKALYKRFGGFAADIIAAIDQAAQDGVDIINLSITPNRRPPGIATFFNPIDMALLSAVKAGIFVVQAAGNTGPAPKSMSSFSPWIFTVGATSHDRVYSNSIILGNNVTIPGVGLASGTRTMHKLVLATHALGNGTTVMDAIYVGECQDSSSFDQKLVHGKILVCSYTVRFILGVSTIKQALITAKNLTAAGLVFYIDPSATGFQMTSTPMDIPGILISSPQYSQALLRYYNSSLLRENGSGKIVGSASVARIVGGMKPTYGITAPKVMYFSARGPDPEDDSFVDADIMKPNLVAPGNAIWGAWSPLGIGTNDFQGERFAMESGTSMSAPHVTGIAALIKQKFPHFTPAAIASALSTTASLSDRKGEHIMAQRTVLNPDISQSPATPFDMGSGFVNATAALDPGLIFDIGYNEYMKFLCSINGSSPVVLNYTGESCSAYNSSLAASDLNLPSVTIAKLVGTRTVLRWVTNIATTATNETYTVGWMTPDSVSVKVSPAKFTIGNGQTRVLSLVFRAMKNVSMASFGRIGLFGDRGHVVNIPVAVIYKIAV
ncbi:Peptidase S8/S53 domain superfamily [Arabidopsis thaliana x Arabidopsis arenosa]|uniref:Peptidase S8/S53 domain superfamily n=1 Tax=Arabidopsis thaliana x Arabidopsis arenosa TaxID=1240361 RepID=A0A8T2C069_9BRAS|nr:Peptidase S8/S53 domain superfamily [Arabidopsis thaliana x Arabidopsis arenosa]